MELDERADSAGSLDLTGSQRMPGVVVPQLVCDKPALTQAGQP